MAMPRAREIRNVDVSGETVTYWDGHPERWSSLVRTDLRRVCAHVGVRGIHQTMVNGEMLAMLVAHVAGNEAPAYVPRKVVTPRTAPAVPRGGDGSALVAALGLSLPRMGHKVLADVVMGLRARLHVWLTGPAGSGKTTVLEQAAEILGLTVYPMSVGPADSPTKFFGYCDANGRYVRTVARDAYEHGGLLIVDEIDNGNPAVNTTLNMMLAQKRTTFPDGVVDRHPDFVVATTANTWGNGADAEYVGRQPQDKAFIDRFGMSLHVGYDQTLERALAVDPEVGSAVHGKDWHVAVVAMRQRASDAGLRVIVSPRATIHGARLLDAGYGHGDVVAMVVTNRMNAEAAKIVTGA